MSKLPSERIKEIHKQLVTENPIDALMNIGGPSDSAIKAINMYLDEQYEQSQKEKEILCDYCDNLAIYKTFGNYKCESCNASVSPMLKKSQR